MSDLFSDMDEVAQQSGGSVFPDPQTDYRLRAEQIANRRKQALALVAQGMQMNDGSRMVGPVLTRGNILGPLAQTIGGTLLNRMVDSDQQQLSQDQRRAQSQWEQAKPDGTDQNATRQWLQQGQSQGLRTDLQRAFMEQDAKAIEAGEQRAADRVAKAEEGAANRQAREQERQDQREWQAHQNELYRRTAADQNRRQGSANADLDRQIKEMRLEQMRNPPGKPLSSQQEKSALELGGQYATVQRLADSFKPEYSGDLRSSLERQFGNVAGGLAPQSTQDMTRWWADQAFMDELPSRHELFGAALTPTEQKSWASAAINPSLSPKVIKERFETRRSIMENAMGRMRGSAVAGGKSGEQFDAATGRKPQQSGAPKAIASQEEWQALPPGTPYVLPDGRKGVR